jgi:hypothetical protein
MMKILTDHPKDVIFVYDSYDIYRKPLRLRHIRENEPEYEVSLNWEEAFELGSKLIELAATRRTIEET